MRYPERARPSVASARRDDERRATRAPSTRRPIGRFGLPGLPSIRNIVTATATAAAAAKMSGPTGEIAAAAAKTNAKRVLCGGKMGRLPAHPSFASVPFDHPLG